MAAKFRIFCDADCQRPALEPNDKQAPATNPSQPTHQHQAALTALVQQQHQQVSKLAVTTAGPVGASAAGTTLAEQEKLAMLEIASTVAPLANRQVAKREPLGLRQPSSQPVAMVESSSALNLANAQASLGEEDRENDISMASLGSDFVPSISHDDDQHLGSDSSFEVEEEEEDSSQVQRRHRPEADSSALIDYEDDDDPLTQDDDFELDEELQHELSNAFKQHDESLLFKSSAYIDDIQSYLKQLERVPDLRPLPNYMDFQTEIDSEKRTILINWLVEVSDEFRLQSETLFICISIIDRFLSSVNVPTSNLQLLGVAAMFIASKYEEIYPPELYQFVEVTDETYSGKQICQMEQEILKTLNFRISLPSVSYFLNQIFAFNKFTKKIYYLAEYLCYLALLVEQPFLEYYPSEIALAAVILAAHQLDASTNISQELKIAYDRSNLDQLNRRNIPKGKRLSELDRRKYTVNKRIPFAIESLREMQHCAYSGKAPLSGDSAIFNRFSSDCFHSVATLPAPKLEDLYLY